MSIQLILISLLSVPRQYRRVFVRGPDFGSDFLHFSSVLNFQNGIRMEYSWTVLRKSTPKFFSNSEKVIKTIPKPQQNHPKTTPDPKEGLRRDFSSFCRHFGIPLGCPWAPFAEPFRFLWLAREPKIRKKQRTGKALPKD